MYIAIVAALFTGIVNFMTGTGSKMITPLLAVWVPWIVMTFLCLIFIFYRKGFKNFEAEIKKKNKLIIILMGIFDRAAWIFYAYAVQDYKISIITVIAGGCPEIAIFMGLWFNKESIKLKNQ